MKHLEGSFVQREGGIRTPHIFVERKKATTLRGGIIGGGGGGSRGGSSAITISMSMSGIIFPRG